MNLVLRNPGYNLWPGGIVFRKRNYYSADNLITSCGLWWGIYPEVRLFEITQKVLTVPLMNNVFSVVQLSLHSIRFTAGESLLCGMQTNPQGRPQHIWTHCTHFILADAKRGTTNSLHSPAHCYSNQRRKHMQRGSLGDLCMGRLNTLREKNYPTHKRSQIDRKSQHSKWAG